jgi:hypothetical protein
VSKLSLLTIDGYYYYYIHDEIMEKEMVTGQEYGMSIGGCNRLCPATTGHSLVALFPCSCRLRTVRCMDPGQVTDLLSRTHTCLWEREGLLLSCHGLRLFSDRLIGGGGR